MSSKLGFLSILLTSILFQGSTLANESFRKFKRTTKVMGQVNKVHVDNRYMQYYRGQLGVWKESHNYSYYSNKFGISIEKIKEVNDIPLSGRRYSKRKYVFYPYATDYITKLYEIGIKRNDWNVPSGEFLWPVKGNRITSRLGKRWGRRHTGIDIAAGRGSIVIAAQSGEVTSVGYNGAFGVSVGLEHGDNYTSLYGHLTVALVKKGDQVKKGQIIAFSGNTGRSTGPHLHFEVRCMGIVLDPEFFLPSFDESMQTKIEFNSIIKSKKSQINNL